MSEIHYIVLATGEQGRQWLQIRVIGQMGDGLKDESDKQSWSKQ